MKTKNYYISPVKVCARISYKESPAHTGRLKHAVDFIVPAGTPVRAALGGVVVDVKQGAGIGGADRKYDKYGNYIELKHKNKEYSIYEHLRKGGALVKKGDKVKRGQRIGYSGKTGWIAHLGAHLHFEVHKYRRKGDYETLEIHFQKLFKTM